MGGSVTTHLEGFNIASSPAHFWLLVRTYGRETPTNHPAIGCFVDGDLNRQLIHELLPVGWLDVSRQSSGRREDDFQVSHEVQNQA
jgi:hypothetical protein